MKMRIEKDSLGELEVPADVYYGIQTTRVAGNYLVSDHTFNEYTPVMKAIAEIKKACAITNAQIGSLDPAKADAIAQACDELIAGQFDGQFPINIWRSQGTGTNMNVNEVVANRANEIMTGHRGYDMVHPNSHVNMCQSSNDVFPTAEAIVFYRKIGELCESAKHLEEVLADKALELINTTRLGRTGLQDAVPMTWGQVIGGWQSMIRRNRLGLEAYRPTFQEVVIGGTILGTGMGVQPGYMDHIYTNLSKVVGFEVHHPVMVGEVIEDSAVFDGMRNTDHQMMLMAHVKALASCLSRMSNDLILCASGPRDGLNEVIFPDTVPEAAGLQAQGTPYVPELMVQVFGQVQALELAATFAANEGQLDHGSFNSGAVLKVYDALVLVDSALRLFADECISQIKINEEVCRLNAELSTSLSTMVSSLYGYPTGVKIAKLALAENISCKEA
ncbi:MAG: lyase, partial [Burkholderiaceae bacterium]|nr:lyase [Burkholderiaceae bacterium]